MAEFVDFMKGLLGFSGGLLAGWFAWQTIEAVTALGAKWAAQAAKHSAQADYIAAQEEAFRTERGI